ncbi:MAG: Bug family tripartite tricarboxylate transporter substrate binding protein, partial [Rhodospirillaceae bacterium]
IPSVLPQVKASRLKALAVGSAHRSRAMPEVPTVAESGVPGYEYATWYGLFAPTGTPRPIVAKLNQAVAAALKNPDLAQSLAAQGSEPNPTSPDELARFMKAEHGRWSRVVQAAGMKAE